jgi:hypothetical protein
MLTITVDTRFGIHTDGGGKRSLWVAWPLGQSDRGAFVVYGAKTGCPAPKCY